MGGGGEVGWGGLGWGWGGMGLSSLRMRRVKAQTSLSLAEICASYLLYQRTVFCWEVKAVVVFAFV